MAYAQHVLVGVLILIVCGVVYRGFGRLESKLIERKAPPLLIGAIRELKEIAGIVVQNLEQTVVKPSKDPTKPGTWSEQIAREVKSQAIDDVNLIGAAARERLQAAGQTPEQIAAIVPRLVEAAVLELRRSKAPPTNGAH